MSSIRFRGDIQGLRAVAVGAVIAFHVGAPFAPGGFVGVDVFFVISGFLITELMLRDRERDASLRQLGNFYARRARRIIPAAATVIIATLLLSVLRYEGLEPVWRAKDAMAAALFYANVHFVDQVGSLAVSHPSPLGHYWSLAVEEQFYAVWPLLFLAVCALAGKRRRAALAGTVAVLGAASFVTAEVWLREPTGAVLNAARAFCLLPPRAWQLGVGALLAIAAPRLVSTPPAARKILQWGGAAAIGASIVVFDGTDGFPGRVALLPTLGAAALLAAGIGTDAGGVIDRVLGSRLFQLGGRYSYSMYLWHLPLYTIVVLPLVSAWLARLALLSVMTIIAAVVTYHLVEKPVRDAPALRLHPPLRSITVGAVCVAVTVFGATAVSARTESTLERKARGAAAVAGEAPETTAASEGATVAAAPVVTPELVSTLATAKTSRYDAPRTTAPLPAAAPTIAVVGDSHAEHLMPALDPAATGVGVHLVTYTLRGCPLFEPAQSSLQSVCDDTRRETFEKLEANRPSLILLSTAGADDAVDDLTRFEARASSALAQFRAIAPVAVVSFTPVARRDTPGCVANHVQAPSTCALRWPVEANAELARLAGASGAGFVDLQAQLCVDTTCPPIIRDQLVYSDAQHFTPSFAATMAPFFTDQLRALLAR